ncbi:MAG: NupC/NupG family nucleoside CNT transporter [Myxococcota bacterium]|nr:NupC/NupG family nucleoside CNT transporter [Myxococcota bacterium]
MSADRRAFPWRLALTGVGLQLVFGVFVLKTELGLALFSFLNDAVGQLLEFTDEGSRFLFGEYLDTHFTVALNVLPTIIFFSALMTVLYHLGVMQRIVKVVAWAMQRTLGTSGAETLSAAANIFVGQTEAPLVIKPYVATMTRSELMAVMTGGFATVAGGVMAAYVGMLRDQFPDIAGHLIAASVMSAPASLVIAKVMIPERETPVTAGTLELKDEKLYANVIDAAATGATDGLKLALNVAAMLLAFLALVAMVNWLFALPALVHNRGEWAEALDGFRRMELAVPEGCTSPSGAAALADCIREANALGVTQSPLEAWQPTSMQSILGWAFWPIAFLMGVPPQDCAQIGALLGERLVLNEFVAYIHLGEGLAQTTPIVGRRAAVIATYALCGFANLGSIAIQIGGIGALAPERRADLARIGPRAMVAGMLACFMTACVAGLLV